jgi:hypothetical protein
VTGTIVEVDLCDRGMVDRFIRVPWFVNRVHHPDPHWVPPLHAERRRYLDRRRNPFFRHVRAAFWLVTRDGQDVGRIAAVSDFDWQRRYGAHEGSFGMFDSINDPSIAGLLLDTATEWLNRTGVTSVLGPFDLSTNYSTGVLVSGFGSAPYLDMPFNPPYYDGLIRNQGFAPERDLWQWRIDPAKPVSDRVLSLTKRVRERSPVRLRNLRKNRWADELNVLLELYNDIWSDNWGFVPLGDAELRHIANGLKPIVRSELALVAEVNGVPVGFALLVPNLNTVLHRMDGKLFPFGVLRLGRAILPGARIDGVRLMLLGIRRDYRRRGIDMLLFVELHRTVNRLAVPEAEIGWTSEDNMLVNRAIEAMGGHLVKTYRVYRRTRGGASP